MDTIVDYTIYFGADENIETAKEECEKIVHQLCCGYIWQKESIILQSYTHQSGLMCLLGSTDVGENINDEWFLLYILFEMSKVFQNAVIQVTDNDGDFILIEAADVLPSWIKPTSSQNRVFIHNNSLHIIPTPSNPADIAIFPTSQPTMTQAYDLVLSEHKTFANQAIQQCIRTKIDCYPSKINEDFHYAHCYIPEEIVYILKTRPNTISAAVQAFYERDPNDVKVCQKMKTFCPTSRLKSCVKFTKYLYSQLFQANFEPDNHSGWRLPARNDDLYKPAALGYKLTCGFAILTSHLNIKDQKQKDVIPNGRFWEEYLTSLKNNGYFQNELEGSKLYQQLLQQAHQQFETDFNAKSSNNSRCSERDLLLQQLIEESKSHHEDIIEYCNNIQPEDSDDWMTLTPEELEQMMLSMWNKTNQQSDESEVGNLTKLVSNMKSFVDNVSSYEGAEVPSVDANLVNEKKDEINFDSNEFMSCIQSLLAGPSGSHGNSSNDDTDESDVEDDYTTCENEGNDVNDEFHSIMNEMDKELNDTTVNKSFQANQEEDFDADVNLIKNFLESFSSQDGLSGPVSNMLQSMGMMLPPENMSASESSTS